MQDLLHVEDSIWIWTEPTGIGIYDFAFDKFFACRHPFRRPERVTVVGRVGAFSDYPTQFAELARNGLELVHTAEEHFRATELPNWYPLIADLTPKSIWFDGPPDPAVIKAELGWPVFMKGIRQTSHHRRSLSIIEGPAELERALESYAQDKVLQWQRIVCRKLERLRPVEDSKPDRIPSSFEFRTFWWRGELAGFGRYWFEGQDYTATDAERAAAIGVAAEAARRVRIPFLVVDVAQTQRGRWIVIECNDGQESGYAGVSPFALWQRIVELERAEGTSRDSGQ